ncbi:MAG: DUF4345 domain-containing protein [Anaerolineales bacterium]
MKALSAIFFYGWVGTLLLLGGAGIFTAEWELARIFDVDLAGMSRDDSSLLNQYRFLKAVEFGIGLFCLVFRREIYSVRAFNRLFLAVVFLGAGARALSIALDGWPHWSFTGIMVLEFLTGIVVALHSRTTLEGA